MTPPKVTVTAQRRLFAERRHFPLPSGWPVPHIGEQFVPPDEPDDGPPYRITVVEHDLAGKGIIVIARPDDFGSLGADDDR